MKTIFQTCVLFLLMALGHKAYSQSIPTPMGQVVSDFSEILSTEEEESLAKKIKAVYQETGNQLFVLTVPSDYYASIGIESFAQLVFEKWKPGQEGADNGLLLILGGSQTDSVNRALRIHTGYAIEAMLTDIECSRIEKDIMVPELKQYHYYEALSKGTDEILKKIAMFKVMVSKPSNHQTFSENDIIMDDAHCFTDAELADLNIRNKNFLGMHICRILTVRDNYFTNGVSDTYEFGKSQFRFDIGVSPWVIVPVKDSALALQIGKRNYELKINSQMADKQKLEAYYFRNGYYKTIVSYLQQVSAHQQKAFMLFLALLFLPLLVWLASQRIEKQQQKKVYTKANVKGKWAIKVWVWILYIFSFLHVLSLTFFQTGITFFFLTQSSFDLTDLGLGWAIALGILNFIAYMFAFVKTGDFIETVLGVKLTGSGSGGSTYSGSSYRSSSSSSYNSSSSYSSSSSSSYSSSSNSGYYGGGGRSGGGGASTSW